MEDTKAVRIFKAQGPVFIDFGTQLDLYVVLLLGSFSRYNILVFVASRNEGIRVYSIAISQSISNLVGT